MQRATWVLRDPPARLDQRVSQARRVSRARPARPGQQVPWDLPASVELRVRKASRARRAMPARRVRPVRKVKPARPARPDRQARLELPA